MKKFLCAFLLAFVFARSLSADETSHTYPNGYRAVFKIGSDLYSALPEKFQATLYPEPISMDPSDQPVIKPVEGSDENRMLRQIAVSPGFIDLINHIAHAKAIDKIQKGYFDQYVANLAQAGSSDTLPDPPNMVNPRYWTDDVMNDQASYFNQMVGMIVAINMSHHYLGHYVKYSDKMSADGKTVPINDLMMPAEWEVSVKAGAMNSLDCAMTTEGVIALFDAFEKMPKRPDWSLYFVPRNADMKKLNKELARYEDDFFHGKLK